MSSVPRHSEEELRQQWAFLDALVDRQAASLKSGIQDPEEDDAVVAMVAPDSHYLDEISTLTQRVTTLEDERSTLLRRIDLSEEARLAAESSREAAESARAAAERALAEARSRLRPWPQVATDPRPNAAAPKAEPETPAAPTPASQAAPAPKVTPLPAPGPKVTPLPAPAPKATTHPGPAPKGAAPKGRRKSWWQRIRE